MIQLSHIDDSGTWECQTLELPTNNAIIRLSEFHGWILAETRYEAFLIDLDTSAFVQVNPMHLVNVVAET